MIFNGILKNQEKFLMKKKTKETYRSNSKKLSGRIKQNKQKPYRKNPMINPKNKSSGEIPKDCLEKSSTIGLRNLGRNCYRNQRKNSWWNSQ